MEEKIIEVELRGPLSLSQYKTLEESLKTRGEYKKSKNRILIDYSTFLPNEGIRERNRDIRLRITNGIPEIIVKLGKWGGSENRKELSVLANTGEFDKLVQIFGALGLTKGILAVRNSQVYEYKGIEFAIVEVPNHSYYFEAEKMISDKEDKVKAQEEILAVLSELGLSTFDDEDFYGYIEKLNKEANEVFDFENYSENYFKNRFNL